MSPTRGQLAPMQISELAPWGEIWPPTGAIRQGATLAPPMRGAIWLHIGCRFLDNGLAPFLVPNGSIFFNCVVIIQCINLAMYAHAQAFYRYNSRPDRE